MGGPATAVGATTNIAANNQLTISATAELKPNFLSNFFRKAFGKVRQSNTTGATSTEHKSHQDQHPTRDSGVSLDNAPPGKFR
jgi:hypothetical protein